MPFLMLSLIIALLFGCFTVAHLTTKLNRLHERCLRMIYNDKQSNFEELLVRDNSVSIHHRDYQRIAIQLYMVVNGMSPDIMSEIFQVRKALIIT